MTHLRLKSASQIDVVTRLGKKCLCCPCCEEFCLYCETVGQFADAADEIERLRTLLDNALEREKDNARQLQIVRKVEADRDRWRNICDYWYKASCSHNWRQDQAARRKYEQAVSGE